MANSYFQFKQFRVEQAGAPMKVTTEGCLFGAWVGDQADNPKRILDIGAGTGLLGLMLAQQFPEAVIDAVEVDDASYELAKFNISKNPWAHRMNVYHQSIQQYQPDHTYDLIVCNPPFFRKSLLSLDHRKSKAKHEQTLTQHDLVKVICRLLGPGGQAFVLYPEAEADQFAALAKEEGLYSNSLLNVCNQEFKPTFRKIQSFSKRRETFTHQNMAIRNADNGYTRQLTHLLNPYYLHL